VFAVVALVKVAAGSAGPNAVDPSLSWLNPFEIDSTSGLIGGVLVAIFIYWGWDSTVTVNEESQNANEGPGKAAVVATLVLVAIYVIVSVAAQAFDGPKQVFGSPLDKILIIAVLTSAAASTQTTILPTTRTSYSMARAGALPRLLAEIHPRFQTPHVGTWLMGGLSIAWYVGLTIVSENILFDSIAALGLMIAFYYGMTGFACTLYYRRELLRSVKAFLLLGVGPTAGGLILTYVFLRSCWDLSKPENSESGDSWFGLGPPLIIGVGFLLMGVVLMVLWARRHPEFFRRRPEIADPRVLETPA
jgi:amino acid transporter